MKKRYIVAGPVLMSALAACGGGSNESPGATNQSVRAMAVSTDRTSSQGSTNSKSALAAPDPVKWHPGHYGLSLVHYTPANVERIHSDWAAILNSDKRFAGVNAFYDWYQLEPTRQGGYDFSAIRNDIKWLNTNFPGRKLIIEVWTRSFTPATSLPKTPQYVMDDKSKIPDYILKGEFDDSGGNPGATWNSNGVIASFWNEPVLRRLKALDAALAAEFDKDETVEVIKYDEYAPPVPLQSTDVTGWTTAKMIAAWKSFTTSMASNWPTTNKVLMANWPRADYTGKVDDTIVTFARDLNVGIGEPDILPPKTENGPGETAGTQLLRAGGENRNIDYRGTIPIVYEAENPVWKMLVTDMETYANTTLKATHLAWLYNPDNVGADWTNPKLGTTPWRTSDNNPNGYPGVVDTLVQNGFRINMACPTVYAGGCKTDTSK